MFPVPQYCLCSPDRLKIGFCSLVPLYVKIQYSAGLCSYAGMIDFCSIYLKRPTEHFFSYIWVEPVLKQALMLGSHMIKPSFLLLLIMKIYNHKILIKCYYLAPEILVMIWTWTDVSYTTNSRQGLKYKIKE